MCAVPRGIDFCVAGIREGLRQSAALSISPSWRRI